MRRYEIIYIISALLDENTIKETSKRFEDILVKNGAKIISSKDLGQKELAYEMKKQKTGYYVLLEVEAEDDKAINEFNRLSLIDKAMIRHLITNK